MFMWWFDICGLHLKMQQANFKVNNMLPIFSGVAEKWEVSKQNSLQAVKIDTSQARNKNLFLQKQTNLQYSLKISEDNI